MMRKGIIIAIGGGNGSGKTQLAKELVEKHSASYLSTAELIRRKHGVKEKISRQTMFNLGNHLSAHCPGWIADYIPSSKYVCVVDGVRRPSDVDYLRRNMTGWDITHIHLDVGLQECAKRIMCRDEVSFDEAMQSATFGLEDSRIMQHIADGGRSIAMQMKADRCDVLIGGQYGSEGKGNVISYLAKEYDVVVRTGGPNAGHKVKMENGHIHCYYHVPSAVLHSTSVVYLAPTMLIREEKLEHELRDLEQLVDSGELQDRLFIHPGAMVINDDHIEREVADLKGRIGSTAQGVGAATADRVLRKALRRVGDTKSSIIAKYFGTVPFAGRVLLEGTQGYGLSLLHSDYPFCTSRDTGVNGLMSEAGIPPDMLGKIYGVFRTYPIRVQSPENGTSGNMRDEIDWETIHKRSGIPMEELVKTETTSTTKRKRRVCEWSWDVFTKTRQENSIHNVVITFADYHGIENRNAKCWNELNHSFRNHFGGVNPCMVSVGFGPEFMLDRRNEV